MSFGRFWDPGPSRLVPFGIPLYLSVDKYTKRTSLDSVDRSVTQTLLSNTSYSSCRKLRFSPDSIHQLWFNGFGNLFHCIVLAHPSTEKRLYLNRCIRELYVKKTTPSFVPSFLLFLDRFKQTMGTCSNYMALSSQSPRLRFWRSFPSHR